MVDANSAPLPDPSAAVAPQTRPPLSGGRLAAVTLLGLGVLGAAFIVMWFWINTTPATGEQKTTAHLEVFKTTANIAVMLGGIGALYLAARRQRTQEAEHAHAVRVAEINRKHAERVAAATEDDAARRRVTELYTKAADQLGSDKAPVRLAGLYALERVGQDNPDQRPTIASLWCAYLRMPYALPLDATPPRTTRAAARTPRRRTGIHRPAPSGTGPAPDPTIARSEAVLERDVRVSVQRLLAKHLRPQADDNGQLDHNYWPEIPELDLTEATLMDLDLSSCTLPVTRIHRATFTGEAGFSGATFTSGARFDHATFTGDAKFDHATFTGDAKFDHATFTGDARFDHATFTGGARFDHATFTGGARFDRATFAGEAGFSGATFTGGAKFNYAKFTDEAGFSGATFSGDTWFWDVAFTGGAKFVGVTFSGKTRFWDVAFTGDARFDRATFTGEAGFSGARFTGAAWFVGVTFSGVAGFGSVTFTGIAGFGRTTFTGVAGFSGAKFTGDAGFEGATFAGDVGFSGATFSGVAGFGGVTFSGVAGFGGATFSRDAWFGDVTFAGEARFSGATFTGEARFDSATFTGDARFGEAVFALANRFPNVQVWLVKGSALTRTWPPGWACDPAEPEEENSSWGRLVPVPVVYPFVEA